MNKFIFCKILKKHYFEFDTNKDIFFCRRCGREFTFEQIWKIGKKLK